MSMSWACREKGLRRKIVGGRRKGPQCELVSGFWYASVPRRRYPRPRDPRAGNVSELRPLHVLLSAPLASEAQGRRQQHVGPRAPRDKGAACVPLTGG